MAMDNSRDFATSINSNGCPYNSYNRYLHNYRHLRLWTSAHKRTLPFSLVIHFGVISFQLKHRTAKGVLQTRSLLTAIKIFTIVIWVKETTSLFSRKMFQWGLIFVFIQQFEINLATHQKRELQQVVDFYDKNFFLSLCRSLRYLQAQPHQ